METSLSWLGRLVKSDGGTEWDRLSNVYGPLISGWIARASVALSDREDLVQEVLIVVIRRVHEFEHQHSGAFRGWLRAILANTLKSYFREHRLLSSPISLDDLSDPASVLSLQHDREHDVFFAMRAMRMVEKDFSPVTWQAFRMQMLEHKSGEQTAELLGISANAALKAKCRVLARIREELTFLLD